MIVQDARLMRAQMSKSQLLNLGAKSDDDVASSNLG